MRYDYQGHTLVTVHNFTSKPKVVRLGGKDAGNALLVDLLDHHDSRADGHGRHTIELPPHVNLDLVTIKPVAQAAPHKVIRGPLVPKPNLD